MAQFKERPTPLTRDDFVLIALRELKDDLKDMRRDLTARMDRIETRMDRIETRVERLEDKLDDVKKEMRSTVRHGQIMVGSVIAIALGVLYFIATRPV